jgi:hypothetical protein
MSEFLPYFAGIITLIFGIGFGLTTLRSNRKEENVKNASQVKS